MELDEDRVPPGPVLAALTLNEALSGREDHRNPAEVRAEIQSAVARWGVEMMTRAFAELLFLGVGLLDSVDGKESAGSSNGDPDTDGGDAIHVIVPAVVTRLCRLDVEDMPDGSVPTMAGALTAAALSKDPHRWRQGIGPPQPGEPLAWCYTVWLLADLIDFTAGQPGYFAELVTDALLYE